MNSAIDISALPPARRHGVSPRATTIADARRRVAAALLAGATFAGVADPVAACDGTEAASPVGDRSAWHDLVRKRLEPIVCDGASSLPTGPPRSLRWNERLAGVARAQADAMAARARLAHQDPTERPLADRLAAAGYPARIAGENVAFGYDTVAELLDAWRSSPSHCRNLAEPAMIEGALACAERDGTRYWALVLGAPAGRAPDGPVTAPAALSPLRDLSGPGLPVVAAIGSMPGRFFDDGP